MAVCLGIYYLLPFVRWDRGPGAPAPGRPGRLGRRFYFFFIEE